MEDTDSPYLPIGDLPVEPLPLERFVPFRIGLLPLPTGFPIWQVQPALGVFGGALGECGEGWNACPCLEECQNREIAECQSPEGFNPVSEVAAAFSPASPSPFSIRKPPPEAARLESVLYQLTQADDVEAFARQRAINLVDGRVRVIVELDEGDVLDMGAGAVIESRYQNLIRVLIPVDQLLPLSQRKGVRFIKLPQRPAINAYRDS